MGAGDDELADDADAAGPAGDASAAGSVGDASEAGSPPARRRLNRAVKQSLRELGAELSRLNQSVGGRLDLKGADLECLDLIGQHGPVSPTVLARLAGLHPATLTGVLDRLEHGGWVIRERDSADRRGVLVRMRRGRGAEVLRLYLVDSGMNSALDDICAGYADVELALLADFMRRAAEAGRAAAARLSDS
jgi:DNA-binding MarR family transcriptional regulator